MQLAESSVPTWRAAPGTRRWCSSRWRRRAPRSPPASCLRSLLSSPLIGRSRSNLRIARIRSPSAHHAIHRHTTAPDGQRRVIGNVIMRCVARVPRVTHIHVRDTGRIERSARDASGASPAGRGYSRSSDTLRRRTLFQKRQRVRSFRFLAREKSIWLFFLPSSWIS